MPCRAGRAGARSLVPVPTPLVLGAKLKLWVYEIGVTQTANLVSAWANQAPGGIASFTAAGAAQPAGGMNIEGYELPSFAALNHLDSVGTLSQLTSRARWEAWGCCALNTVPTVFAGAAAYQGAALIGSNAVWWGVFANQGSAPDKIVLTASVFFNNVANQWISSAEFSVNTLPILWRAWADGVNINLEVDGITSVPKALAGISALGDADPISIGHTGTLRGMPGPMIVCNDVLSPAEVAQMRAYFSKYGTGRQWTRTPAIAANMWGNGKVDTTPPAWSPSAFQVVSTDGAEAQVDYSQPNGEAVDQNYFSCALLSSPPGETWGTTTEARLAQQAQAGIYRSAILPVAQGAKRLFAIGTPADANAARTSSIASILTRATAATTSVVVPASRVVALDGYAGKTFAQDGYSSPGGVLNPALAPTRAATMARLLAVVTANSITALLFVIGSNDMAIGTPPSEFQVSMAAFFADCAATFPGVTIYVQTITRRTALEGSLAPPFRAAESAQATASGKANWNGLPILSAIDLGDGTHPIPAAEHKLNDAVIANIPGMPNLIIYADSIWSGSMVPTAWSAVVGAPALLRTQWI